MEANPETKSVYIKLQGCDHSLQDTVGSEKNLSHKAKPFSLPVEGNSKPLGTLMSSYLFCLSY